MLSLLGGYAIWWLSGRSAGIEPIRAGLGSPHIEQLQQSVDAIAIEVERIGEAQRFDAKLRAEENESAR